MIEDLRNKKTFANQIRLVRLNNNMTQTELAKKIGLKQSTIAGWESGFSAPTRSTLKKLRNVFPKDFSSFVFLDLDEGEQITIIEDLNSNIENNNSYEFDIYSRSLMLEICKVFKKRFGFSDNLQSGLSLIINLHDLLLFDIKSGNIQGKVSHEKILKIIEALEIEPGKKPKPIIKNDDEI